MTNQKKFLNGLIRWLPLVGLVLFFGLILWGYSRGIFHSVASLQAFIKQFGNYAVLCFILFTNRPSDYPYSTWRNLFCCRNVDVWQFARTFV